MAGRTRGCRKTGGRKQGTPNKFTSSVKSALDSAFNELGAVSALVAWAKENPGDFYRLWVKLLPKQASESIATADSHEEELGAAIRSKLAEISAKHFAAPVLKTA